MTLDERLREAGASLAAVDIEVPPFRADRRRTRRRHAATLAVSAITIVAVAAAAAISMTDRGTVDVTPSVSGTTTSTTTDQLDVLCAERVQLLAQESELGKELNVARVIHSPDAAMLDAKHQTVVRVLGDLQARIHRLQRDESSGPSSCPNTAVP
jgi:hypothetical protein